MTQTSPWRIVWHWTAGKHTPSAYERRRYHFLIDGSGNVVSGAFPVEANVPPLRSGKYAAHTLSLNSHSIGISLAAMSDAQERPFATGPFPITDAQVAALVKLTAQLAKQYDVPVTRQRMLSHAEVQPTLGVRQRNKWDIMWLPDMAAPSDPLLVGDRLRAMVQKEMQPTTTTIKPNTITRHFRGADR